MFGAIRLCIHGEYATLKVKVTTDFNSNVCKHHHYVKAKGHFYGKLFIRKLCKKRADDLLKQARHQLQMVVAILMGRVPVRRHLYIMGMFDGDPTYRFCRTETETVQHIICCCEALTRQLYSAFGKLFAEPNDIRTVSIRDLLPLYKKHRVTEPVWNGVFKDAQ